MLIRISFYTFGFVVLQTGKHSAFQDKQQIIQLL